jgi:hypothetical protein
MTDTANPDDSEINWPALSWSSPLPCCTGSMTGSDVLPNRAAWVRLSDAQAQLRSAGIGNADIISSIAWGAFAGQIIVTGFQSVRLNGERHSAKDRDFSRRIFWRVLTSDKAPAVGFVPWMAGESIGWTGRKDDAAIGESYSCVLIDQPSFALLAADISARIAADVLLDADVVAWIRRHDGTNSKGAWASFRAEFGRRAGKRDRFHAVWLQVQENPQRGRPKNPRIDLASRETA